MVDLFDENYAKHEILSWMHEVNKNSVHLMHLTERNANSCGCSTAKKEECLVVVLLCCPGVGASKCVFEWPSVTQETRVSQLV